MLVIGFVMLFVVNFIVTAVYTTKRIKECIGREGKALKLAVAFIALEMMGYLYYKFYFSAEFVIIAAAYVGFLCILIKFLNRLVLQSSCIDSGAHRIAHMDKLCIRAILSYMGLYVCAALFYVCAVSMGSFLVNYNISLSVSGIKEIINSSIAMFTVVPVEIVLIAVLSVVPRRTLKEQGVHLSKIQYCMPIVAIMLHFGFSWILSVITNTIYLDELGLRQELPSIIRTNNLLICVLWLYFLIVSGVLRDSISYVIIGRKTSQYVATKAGKTTII